MRRKSKKRILKKHRLKPELYPYQLRGIRRMVKRYRGRCLLADEMGLGKSVQALHAAMPYRGTRPIVVICPNTVKYTWEAEVKIHTDLHCWVLEGIKPPTKLPLRVPPIIILNWDILDAWCDRLISLRPNVVIGDEIQNAKSPKAKRTRALKRLCKGIPYIYFLSGTPIENRPAEFFTALHILRPHQFPYFRRYGNEFCDPKITYWGVQYNGASNVEKLNRILRKSVMIRRTQEQVMKDLPPLTRSIVPLSIDMDEYRAAHRKLMRRLFASRKSISQTSVNQLAHLTKLLRQTALLKLPLVQQWIDEFLETTDRKLVVFGHHRTFLETLYGSLSEVAVLVYGGVTGRKRHEAIQQFAQDSNTRVFIGGIMAAGTGINYLTAARDVVLGELVWVPAKLQQVEKRLHRIGQDHPVTAHYLIARNTVEDILCRTIQRKQKTLNSILDGKSQSHEFDILTSVVKSLYEGR